MANFEYQGFATLGVNLNRQKYGPLDISQVFKTQGDLNYYLSKGADKTAVSEYWADVVPYPYAGQVVALSADGADPRLFVLKEKADGTFETSEVGFSGDTSALKDRVTALETAVGKEAAGEEAATGLFARMAAAESDIDGVQHELDGDTAGTFAYAIGQHLADIDQKIGAAKNGDTAATGLYKYIDDSVAAATPEDYATVKAQVETNKTNIATLVGDDASKSARAIASEEVAKIVAGADTAYDTLKEISDWISNHTDDAATMSSDINALKTTVGDADSGLVKDAADLKTAVGDSTKGLTKDVADLKKELDASDSTSFKFTTNQHLANLDNEQTAQDEKITALETAVGTKHIDGSTTPATGIYAEIDGATDRIKALEDYKNNTLPTEFATRDGNLTAHAAKMASATEAGHMSATDKAKLDKLKELTKANIDEAYGTGNDALTTKGYVDEQVGAISEAAIDTIKLNGATLDKESGMVDIPLATQEKDGLMAADDKKTVDAAVTKIVLPGIISEKALTATDGSLTLENATQAQSGLMSAADKTNLDGLVAKSFVEKVKVGTTEVAPVSGVLTLPNATTAEAGLMSKDDKAKLDSAITSVTIGGTSVLKDDKSLAFNSDAFAIKENFGGNEVDIKDGGITDAKIAAVSVSKLSQANTEDDVLILYGGNASGHVHA